MSKVEKRPDYNNIFSSAGNTTAPDADLQKNGYKPGDIPVNEVFNNLINESGLKSMYHYQNGIAVYDPNVEFEAGAIVRSGNKYYRALTDTIGFAPESYASQWRETIIDKEFSSADDVRAGTSDNTIVSPSTLHALKATEEQAGIIKCATDAETELGLSRTTAVTPKSLRAVTIEAGKLSLESLLDIIEPIGAVIKPSFDHPGPRYVPCLGQNINDLSDFPKLQEYLRMKGATNLHDMRGKVLKGSYDLSTGTIELDQNKKHSHLARAETTDLGTKTTASAGEHSHPYSGSVNGAGGHTHDYSLQADAAGSHAHTVTGKTSEGGQHSHANDIKVNAAGGHDHKIDLFTKFNGSHHHTGETYEAGEHAHDLRLTRHGGNGEQTIQQGNDTGQQTTTKLPIYTAGAHTHTFDTKDAGTHSHHVLGRTEPVASHTHSLTGGVLTDGLHDHTVTGGTNTVRAHTHTISGNINPVADHAHTYSGNTDPRGDHEHTMYLGNHGHTVTVDEDGGDEVRVKSISVVYYVRGR